MDRSRKPANAMVPSSSLLIPTAHGLTLAELSSAQREALVDQLDADLGGLPQRARLLMGGEGIFTVALGLAIVLQSATPAGWVILAYGGLGLTFSGYTGMKRRFARDQLQGILKKADADRLFAAVSDARRIVDKGRRRSEADRLLPERRERLYREVEQKLARS